MGKSTHGSLGRLCSIWILTSVFFLITPPSFLFPYPRSRSHSFFSIPRFSASSSPSWLNVSRENPFRRTSCPVLLSPCVPVLLRNDRGQFCFADGNGVLRSSYDCGEWLIPMAPIAARKRGRRAAKLPAVMARPCSVSDHMAISSVAPMGS